MPIEGETVIELIIPMRAEYVSIARLTAAGVANRAGFDIESIEDIKVSLSEVCNRIISAQSKFNDNYDSVCKIKFILDDVSLGIDFYVDRDVNFKLYATDDKNHKFAASGIWDEHIGIDVNGTRLVYDNSADDSYEDHLQLALVNLLMDEFIVNPNESCLVSMRKYLEGAGV